MLEWGVRIRHAYLWPGILVGILLIIAAAVLSVVIAPNRYKGKIESAVTTATGRRLELAGDIALSITRWISLNTGNGVWRADSHADSAPLAQWRSASIRVRLLPLLKGHVVLDVIRAQGLHLTVRRDAQGRSNWDLKPKHTVSTGRHDPGRTLAVGGIELADASIDYEDRRADLRARIDSLSLKTNEWTKGAEVRLRAKFHAMLGAASKPPSNADVGSDITITTRLQADPELESFALHQTSLDARLTGGRLASGGIAANLDVPRLAVVIDPLAIEVPTYALDLDQSRTTGSLALEQTPAGLHARGPVQFLTASARRIIGDLGLDTPLPRDPQTLGKVSVDGTWELTGGALKIQPLTVQIDATRFDGELARSAGPRPRLTFDLHADRMDLGAYADVRSSHPAPFELPLDALRAFNAQGQIVVERARLSDAQLKRVTLRVESHE